jgi:hypothetical protein
MDFSWTTIIIVILLIIIVYFVWTMLSSSSTTVSSGGQNASKSTPMTVTASNSFTISTWVYVNSWDSTSNNKTIVSTPKDSKSPFSLTLGTSDNGLYVTIGTQQIPPVTKTLSTILIPLQTWVSIIATVNNGNSLDIYINGKLVQTTALDNVYGLLAGTINVGGGIDGSISSTFNSTPFGPQDAWNTYSSGYGGGSGSSVSDFFNKYKVRFAFVKDNVELSSLDI